MFAKTTQVPLTNINCPKRYGNEVGPEIQRHNESACERNATHIPVLGRGRSFRSRSPADGTVARQPADAVTPSPLKGFD